MSDVIKVRNPINIPVSRIHRNPWNPNVQSDVTFNNLVEEIRTDGFDQPIQVVPCNCAEISGPHYMIIGGEHRWKAAVVLEMVEIPAIVYEEWDDTVQKLKTVRRNLISGELDDRKFTALIQSLKDDTGMTESELTMAMGFESEDQFARHIIEASSESDQAEKSWLKEMLDQTEPEIDAVNAMTDVLHNIFSKYGDTVPQSFMFFAYKGKTHLMVLMDGELYKAVEGVVGHLKESDSNINDFLLEKLRGDKPNETTV